MFGMRKRLPNRHRQLPITTSRRNRPHVMADGPNTGVCTQDGAEANLGGQQVLAAGPTTWTIRHVGTGVVRDGHWANHNDTSHNMWSSAPGPSWRCGGPWADHGSPSAMADGPNTGCMRRSREISREANKPVCIAGTKARQRGPHATATGPLAMVRRRRCDGPWATHGTLYVMANGPNTRYTHTGWHLGQFPVGPWAHGGEMQWQLAKAGGDVMAGCQTHPHCHKAWGAHS